MRTLTEVARFLRSERIRRELTQAELAARAGLALRTYQRLEAGDPGTRVAALLRACGALGYDLAPASSRRPTLDELGALYGHEDAT